MNQMDHLSFIIAYEDGAIHDVEELINGFAAMIKDGVVWQLQGHYGRTAASFIENGYISPEGDVLRYPEPE